MKTRSTIFIIIIIGLLAVIMFLLLNIQQVKKQIKLKPAIITGVDQTKAQRLNQRIDELLLIEKRIDLWHNYLEELPPPTEEIAKAQAQTLYDGYKGSLSQPDLGSRLVTMNLTEIIKGMKAAFNMNDSDWLSPTFFDHRAITIYFGNYGNNPATNLLPQGENPVNYKNRNTAILTFTSRANVNSDWNIEKDEAGKIKYYDFGDLHPPKNGIAGGELTW